ncbi:MAG TPA: hypothetical protein PK156_44905 [Polyangium sp.]|nr:hypothetical protein [Polyangium sp.]
MAERARSGVTWVTPMAERAGSGEPWVTPMAERAGMLEVIGRYQGGWHLGKM